MAKVEVLLPQLGEGVIEATITRWLIEHNNTIEEDEPLVEIATDKVDSEVPSPATGILIKQFFNEGETPKVGDVIAIIQTGDDEEDDSETEILVEPDVITTEESVVNEELNLLQPTANSDSLVSPFIRHFASQRGISFEELKSIAGTGDNGAVIKQDIHNYFKREKATNSLKNLEPDNSSNTFKKEVPEKDAKIQPDYVPKEGEEIVEIDRTRKLIAEYMVKSVQTAPHVTSTVEIDVTHIVQWREKIKADFKTANKANLTYTPIILEKVSEAIKEFPGINVSLYGDKLIKKKYINIGIATALPDGNLIVPVIRNVDHKNLTKLTIEIADITGRARTGNLKPGETAGGTFTITNLGQFNNIMGTPIINQPESAILAVGAIKKKPWVVTEENMQSIGIRDILTLSLSYDHRIIDGALGGAFLNKIGELLENYSPTL